MPCYNSCFKTLCQILANNNINVQIHKNCMLYVIGVYVIKISVLQQVSELYCYGELESNNPDQILKFVLTV